MIRLLLPLLLLAAPAQALTLADLAGRWRGEGEYAVGAEPAQRLRCQLRGQMAGEGRVVLTGRCATAQGGQSFAWLLTDRGGGRVLAEDRQPPAAPNDPVPLPVEGLIGAEGLRFATPDGGRFDLAAEEGALVLRLRGEDQGRPVAGSARLVAE